MGATASASAAANAAAASATANAAAASGMHVVCTWCAAAFQRPAASLQRACNEELTLVSKTWLHRGNYEGLRGHRECGTSGLRS